tara:strand:- start:738 stop:1334 length:597 start_codon:yes stop_codon:yes gene_type:complete
MKKLIIFIFSILLLGSCSSEKVFSERLTHNWNINYLENHETLSSKFIINEQETEQIIDDKGIEAIKVNDDVYASHKNLSIKKNFSVINSIEKKEIKQQLEKLKIKSNLKYHFKQSIEEEVKEPELHWAALTGMICGILGLLVAGFILGTLGIIFGGIGLNKINKNPDKYKGKGMAVTGIVTGIVGIIVLVFLFAFLLS